MSDSPRERPTRDDAGVADDDGPDARLDALLASARWPEPSAVSQQRLRDAWGRISGRRRFPARSLASLAAAAAVALAVVTVWRAAVKEQERPALVKGGPERVEGAPSTAATTRGGIQDSPPYAATWRPPTAWEAALVAPPTRSTTSATQSTRAAARDRPSLIDRIVAGVGEIAADPDRVQQVAGGFAPGERRRVEQRLSQDIPAERSAPRRRAAVRLLAAICTSRSAPLLASLAVDPDLRPHALDGLERVGDVPTLTALAASARDETERRRLLVALLRRDPGHAVPVFLAFLQDGATEGAALAALGDVKHPPVDALFARLNDPRTATRLAAARAIGRINGPDVTARLAWMLRNNVNRREALVALASSEGAEARRLFEWALESKEFGAAARAARQSL